MKFAGPLPRLMLVTDRRRTRGRRLVPLVHAAVEGGVDLVQIRERDLGPVELGDLVRTLKREIPGTPLLVNSSIDVARAEGLGLHLPAGVPGIGAEGARIPLYGRSVHDEAELHHAVDDLADYVVAGTIFPSDSKPGRRAAGVGLIERFCRQVHPLPVFAIGGLSVSRVPGVIHSGAHGVAVCGAILGDNDPRRVAQAFRLALDVACRARA